MYIGEYSPCGHFWACRGKQTTQITKAMNALSQASYREVSPAMANAYYILLETPLCGMWNVECGMAFSTWCWLNRPQQPTLSCSSGSCSAPLSAFWCGRTSLALVHLFLQRDTRLIVSTDGFRPISSSFADYRSESPLWSSQLVSNHLPSLDILVLNRLRRTSICPSFFIVSRGTAALFLFPAVVRCLTGLAALLIIFIIPFQHSSWPARISPYSLSYTRRLSRRPLCTPCVDPYPGSARRPW